MLPPGLLCNLLCLRMREPCPHLVYRPQEEFYVEGVGNHPAAPMRESAMCRHFHEPGVSKELCVRVGASRERRPCDDCRNYEYGVATFLTSSSASRIIVPCVGVDAVEMFAMARFILGFPSMSWRRASRSGTRFLSDLR